MLKSIITFDDAYGIRTVTIKPLLTLVSELDMNVPSMRARVPPPTTGQRSILQEQSSFCGLLCPCDGIIVTRC